MRDLDCLIISTGRAASTATYKYLSEIGNLRLPANKEPHFWCDLRHYAGRYDLLNQLYVKESQPYEQLYRDSRMMIDASVGYFFYIDDVLQKLCDYSQKPKILFLYRDPVSRAVSLFNELTKKGLEHAKNVQVALQSDPQKPVGLWWEHYYDNVYYETVFKRMTAYFDQVLAVNYDALKRSPAQAIDRILDFVGIQRVKTIDYRPINTSAQAVLAHKTRRIRWLGQLVPASAKCLIESLMVRMVRYTRHVEPPTTSFSSLLPRSITEYTAFQISVQEKDYYDSTDY
jgi:hypothetical protein